jgi:hypothetical protein
MVDVMSIFEAAPDRDEPIRRNPVTGGHWVPGLDPFPLQLDAAALALTAQRWFARTGPADAPPLPISYEERQLLKSGGLGYIVAEFAASLERNNYDWTRHPSFDDYARGVMASPYTADYVVTDAKLIRRYPPQALPGLGRGLVWCPS